MSNTNTHYMRSQAAQAADAERKRIAAILALRGAMDTAAAAAQQCIAAGTPAKDAARLVGTFRPAAPKANSAFWDAMSAVGNPNVTSLEPADEVDPGAAVQAGWDSAFRRATIAAQATGGRQ